MEAIVQSNQEHLNMTEDSSDRSDESSTMSQEYKSRGFEDYDIVKRMKVSVGERCSTRCEMPNINKSRDFRLSIESNNIDSSERLQNNALQFDDVHRHELSLNLGKSKKYDFPNVHLGDVSNYHTEKNHDPESRTESSQICGSKDPTMKDALFNLQSAQEKYLAASFERSPKEFNYLVEREIKEYGIAKGYNLTADRMKEFNLPHEQPRENLTNGIPSRERLNGIGILDLNDHRSLHGQARHPQDLECIVYERMRRPQHHFLNRMDFSGQNLTTALHVRQTSVTQSQQSQQQQQQEQQIKSFTIDAILAHRNNHRERYQRNQQQLRKTARAARQECQEITGKNGQCSGKIQDGNVNEVAGVVNNGKAKRVRTIFTAEQLERLEGEFARQQYMVGPERLYLAHALRLTEAQVKVWFQNRRIKWRKVNHEQHCQAVSEHRQRCSLPGSLEIHEDESNETSNVNWCPNSTIAANTSSDESSLINASSQLQRDIRDSSIIKS